MYASLRTQTDVFPVVASFPRKEMTAVDTSAFAG